jgi:hypothetical protein
MQNVTTGENWVKYSGGLSIVSYNLYESAVISKKLKKNYSNQLF